MLSAQWKNIDWHKAEREVNRLQIRIVKATQQKDYNAVKRLQYLLTHSFYAKALAVKRVVTNDGRKTPGVDGVLWNTPAKKMKAVLSLTDKGYRARPLRRVYIEKKDKKKKRPLGIPTMYDRAMQALYALALEPVAETTADGKSFGFRKGRCAQDACEYLFNALSRKHISPKWVLEGDIKGCFDHISHEWLLDNIPMDKVLLRKWLKSGFIFNKQLFPTEEGTPQGGIISPTLANMTLDGLEKLLADSFPINRSKKNYYTPMINLVRYADDFIITGESKELLENHVKPLVIEFLQARGLTLSEEKTKITHIEEGFDFLGFNIRKYKGKFITKPSKKSRKRFLDKVREIVDKNKSSKQQSLIRLLNPVIRGWANYYKGCSASETFRKTDAQIFNKLWRWSRRRHPKKGKRWIANKYYHTVRGRSWTFAVPLENRKVDKYHTLVRLSDTKIKRHIKIRSEANPYDADWKDFFDQYKTRRMLAHLDGKQYIYRLWNQQMQCCPVCGKHITRETPWKITEMTGSSRKAKVLIYDHCSRITNRNKWKLL